MPTAVNWCPLWLGAHCVGLPYDWPRSRAPVATVEVADKDTAPIAQNGRPRSVRRLFLHENVHSRPATRTRWASIGYTLLGCVFRTPYTHKSEVETICVGGVRHIVSSGEYPRKTLYGFATARRWRAAAGQIFCMIPSTNRPCADIDATTWIDECERAQIHWHAIMPTVTI